MTVVEKGRTQGVLQEKVHEEPTESIEVKIIIQEKEGHINGDITIGANTADTQFFKANVKLASQGANPLGLGF